MSNCLRLLSFLSGLSIGISGFAASKDEVKGLKIIRAAEAFHEGFKDLTANGEMILQDASGEKATPRKMILKILEGNGDKSKLYFSYPRDVEKTEFLTHAHPNKEDEQWIYLPTLGKTTRIQTSNKNGPFLGSEFSFDDLIPRTIEKYRYQYVHPEKCRKRVCHVIDSMPKEKNHPYPRQRIWLESKNYLTFKVEFYNRKNELEKTMKSGGYKKYQGKHWSPAIVQMKNHKNNRSTVFKYSEQKFSTGLDGIEFKAAALGRG